MAAILVVDDDPDACGSIRRVLEDAGHFVTTASNGQECLNLLGERQPDLVILDIIMPQMSGLDVCRRIRADPFHAKLPIIFLTAKSRPGDAAEALDAGGDDYITKPFEVIDLPARIRALLRRSTGGLLDTTSDVIQVGDMQLHTSRFEIHIAEDVFELTTVEFRLLHYLMTHAGQPVSIPQLLEHVWEYPPGIGDAAIVYVHIANLRKKIEPQPDSPRYIRSVRGSGYIINP